VKDESPRHEIGGRTVYFCCAGCAEYFQGHRARVLAQRHLDEPARAP